MKRLLVSVGSIDGVIQELVMVSPVLGQPVTGLG